MQIAIVLYPGFTALDALGPYELLKFLPGVEICFVSKEVGPIATDRGILVVGATHSYDEVSSPDIVLIPGSEAQTATAAADGQLIGWLGQVHKNTRFTTSVCSGSVILASAGMLEQRPATSHWAAMGALKRLGAKQQPSQRIVRSDKIWTAAGVSAGLDLALELIIEIAGKETAERIQLLIEYDPKPSVDAGHMTKASEPVALAARSEMKALSRNVMAPFGRHQDPVAKCAWKSAPPFKAKRATIAALRGYQH